MAIIDSIVIGTSKKSMGNMTLRKVRGRSIGSKKIMENLSNTEKQAAQRTSFKDISQLMAKISFLINQSYEKSRYGSARNNFFKINKEWFKDKTGMAELQSPVDVVEFLLENNLPYIAYGGGSGTISSYMASEVNPENSQAVKATLYNVKEGDCTAKLITINEQDGVSIIDYTDQIVFDAESQTATVDTEGGTSTSREYGVFIVTTPSGIVRNPYILETGPVSGGQ